MAVCFSKKCRALHLDGPTRPMVRIIVLDSHPATPAHPPPVARCFQPRPVMIRGLKMNGNTTMRTMIRLVVVLTACTIAPAVLAQSPAKTSGTFPLTVDSIMRGPDLVGYPPDGLRWSADSGKLYFEWRRPGEEEASTYVVSRDGGMPSRLDDAQRKTAPPANGRWDKAHKRVVFADRGDIAMIDEHGTRHQITPTA